MLLKLRWELRGVKGYGYGSSFLYFRGYGGGYVDGLIYFGYGDNLCYLRDDVGSKGQ